LPERLYEGDWKIFVCLLIAFLAWLSLWLYQLYNRNLAHEKQEQGALLKDVELLSSKLAHDFSGMNVDNYLFRGIKAPAHPINIGFKDLALELPNGQKILQSVTGEFSAGNMTAIMGPSGAGKTSFMNALCGKAAAYGKTSGEVLINGKVGDISSIKNVTGFVPQDDIVHEYLTVRENIAFSAALRNRARTRPVTLENITEDVLQVMQIDHIQNSIVGGVQVKGISGGQKKRVNIGMELAARPSLIFLDEPTSGLDSTASLAIVNSLNKMARLGTTIIMVIHQPRYSLFTLFDEVLLLGKGGLTVYLGPSSGAKPYFENLGFVMPQDENPADWVMDCIAGEVNNTKVQKFDPTMLPGMWESGKDNLHEMLASTELSVERAASGPRHGHLRNGIREEWRKIAPVGERLDIAKFTAVLTVCIGETPEQEVVAQLMTRIIPEGEEGVTLEALTQYLISRFNIVAQDQQAAIERAGSMMTRPPRLWERDLKECVQDMKAGQCQAQAKFGRWVRTRIFRSKSAGTPELSVDEDAEAGIDLSQDTSCDDEGPAPEDRHGRQLDRRLPGFFSQLRILMRRSTLQWWRLLNMRMLFFLVLMFGAAVVGITNGYIYEDPEWSPDGFLNAHMTVALLISVYALTAFSQDQPVFWRESSHGLNRFAFFLSRVLVGLLDMAFMALFYTTTYYIVIAPGSGAVLHYFLPFVMVGFTAACTGFCIACCVPPTLGPFVAALVSFVCGGLLGPPARMGIFLDSDFLSVVVSTISYTRWSVPANFLDFIKVHPASIQNLTNSESYILNAASSAYDKSWFNGTDRNFLWCNIGLLCQGFLFLIIAYLGLLLTNRKRQI
jgi:ABC-type multidrug transport system ATPase subunit